MPLSLADRPSAQYTPPDASQTGDLTPVQPAERIHALDLFRGWAMFGVLWSNLNDWYGTRDPVTRLDGALAFTQQWLIEERFFTTTGSVVGARGVLRHSRDVSRGLLGCEDSQDLRAG